MCLIVDANLASVVFSDQPSKDFLPLLDWLTNKDGKLVVGGQLAKEVDRVGAARRFVRVLLQAGRARRIPSKQTDNEAKSIANRCDSNDAHVIALARISGARILCSGDKMLHRDFTNLALISNPKGHIYQSVKHERLLRSYGHTEACRRSMSLS